MKGENTYWMSKKLVLGFSFLIKANRCTMLLQKIALVFISCTVVLIVINEKDRDCQPIQLADSFVKASRTP